MANERISATFEVDPISRIEGHLGVRLTTDASGVVTDAQAHGNLWRGFENFLIGREPNDAITFTQRICGVCPVPHGTTATYAVEDVLGYSDGFQTYGDGDNDGLGVPTKAVHARNLVLSAEFLMSSITHFYHLAAPSYIQGPNIPPWTPYFNGSYYHTALLSDGKGTGNLTGAGTGGTLPANEADGFSKDVWSAIIKQYVKALRIRRLTFEGAALFAGRMPMTSSFVAGGVTLDSSVSLQTRCDKYEALLKEVGTFIVQEYVPLVLALGVFYPNFDNVNNGGLGYGAGWGNFLAWGAFPDPSGQTLAIKGGTKLSGGAVSLLISGKSDVAAAKVTMAASLREHIKHSRYADFNNEFGGSDAGNAYPGNVSRTKPKRGVATTKYSWLKAPRWNGNPMEVGPLARLVVNGWYPVTNVTLASIVPGYTSYVKNSGGNIGLDPAMVSADLAVALVSAGLASIKVGGTTYTTRADAIAHYNDATAVIMGAVTDWIYGLKGGLSTMDRLRARGLESLVLVGLMIGSFTKGATGLAPLTWPSHGGWVGTLRSATGSTYIHKSVPLGSVSGFGATEAPRGALAHFITINRGKIDKYQCVVPTTWNGSPKDGSDVQGPIEKAMMGVVVKNFKSSYTKQDGATDANSYSGVEALRVAQSFDPCIACAVH
ncbi:MAG: nickel-dependent hydrogenase large subunit [Coriobacteriia bacterium]